MARTPITTAKLGWKFGAESGEFEASLGDDKDCDFVGFEEMMMMDMMIRTSFFCPVTGILTNSGSILAGKLIAFLYNKGLKCCLTFV